MSESWRLCEEGPEQVRVFSQSALSFRDDHSAKGTRRFHEQRQPNPAHRKPVEQPSKEQLNMRAFCRIFLLFGAGVAASSQLLPDDYQDTQEPTPLDGSPIVVEISWNIKGVYEVNFREMSVLLAMYFRMQWREPRLKGAEANGGAAVPLHSQFLERLWLPDLYIHEARDITSYKMVEKVEGLYLTPPDTILYSTLLQLKLACPMFFAKYPFDVQVCTMTVSSY
ncbi:gamma-aminobutyric acid receptor subunit delta-like [Penaeus japonicus]|uniref:gamma-aminobutyric acid receptor subunit delta-like n=1 Tax=Penaeus japonicus TaxID=27405 RepID=UPI001C70C163|nr:gamma-aminobutyric acid receptor subunit delta-like [Penaeus japonicus]